MWTSTSAGHDAGPGELPSECEGTASLHTPVAAVGVSMRMGDTMVSSHTYIYTH
jgi:hypothetical protein